MILTTMLCTNMVDFVFNILTSSSYDLMNFIFWVYLPIFFGMRAKSNNDTQICCLMFLCTREKNSTELKDNLVGTNGID
jgi:hypothetical protein